MPVHIAEIGFPFMAYQRDIVEVFDHVIEVLVTFSSFVGVDVSNNALLAGTINPGQFSRFVPLIGGRIIPQIAENAGIPVGRPGDSIFFQTSSGLAPGQLKTLANVKSSGRGVV